MLASENVKKWLNATFSSFHGFCLSLMLPGGKTCEVRKPEGFHRVSKKWLNATFLSFTGFASRIRSRAAKPAKYENLWVFIRSDAHVVRAGLNIRGCGPLSTPGFFDRLRKPEGFHPF